MPPSDYEFPPVNVPTQGSAFGDSGQGNWRAPSAPIDIAGDYDAAQGNWRPATYPIDVGFDPSTFLMQNKVAVCIGAALLVGGLALYFESRR